MEKQVNDSEQDILREAISFKKEKHRVEIRKKTIQNILRTKRINHQAALEQNYSQTISKKNEDIFMANSSGMDIKHPSTKFIPLELYVNTINAICDNKECQEQSDKVFRCLNVLKAHIYTAVHQKDIDEQEKQLRLFLTSGGALCVLQFLSGSYCELPKLQLEAVSIIGNIYAMTDKPILTLMIENGVVSFMIELLVQTSAIILEQENHCTQDNTRMNLLGEIIRTLANMAGESYEYRMQLIYGGICRYLEGQHFERICLKAPLSFAELVLFLSKNMVSESPCIGEEHREKFIPIITAIFTLPDLTLEAIQDGIMAIKSFAKYGNTVLRAKMIANRNVFEKLHELVDFKAHPDVTNIYYSFVTLKEFMKFSDRQAEYVFNISGDILLEHFKFYLEANTDQPITEELQKKLVDIQILIIEILTLYIVCDEPLFFAHIFGSGFEIIKLVLHIATFHPNNKINFRAKEFIFTCIEKADYLQQITLVSHEILQPLVDAVAEDEPGVMLKAMRAICILLSRAESQIESNPLTPHNNSIKTILEQRYSFRQILESIQAHQNNDIHEAALFILENFFSSLQ